MAAGFGIRPGMERLEPPEPVPAQLVAHWTFDEGQGQTVHDSSGSDYHGTIVGAAWAPGKRGGYNVWERQPGANFHGSLDEVRIYRGMLSAGQVAELAREANRESQSGLVTEQLPHFGRGTVPFSLRENRDSPQVVSLQAVTAQPAREVAGG